MKVTLPGREPGQYRRQVVFYAPTEQVADAKAEAFKASAKYLAWAAAGALGGHTPREWGDLLRAAEGGWRFWPQCFYCKARRHSSRMTRDHKTPIVRGGSDRIENIAVCCADCNRRKGTMTSDEFLMRLTNA